MKYKRIHFTGIKGVGMTPLAIIAKEAGCIVTGSDVAEDFITKTPLEKAGIIPFVGFDQKHIEGVDLVVVTGAHGGAGNIEVQAAKDKNIPVVSQGEYIGMLVDGEITGKKFEGISVAGTHGKTTTTAMITTILAENNMDPSYLIGTSSISSLPAPGHYGKGNYFVIEADEYATDPKYDKKPKFLWQHPKFAVFTNIEYDHMDIFESIDDVRSAFLQFAKQIKDDGILVAYGDDPEVQKVLKEYGGRVITYGFFHENDYVLTRVTVSREYTFFQVDAFGASLGEFSISVTGEHNALNALASIIIALETGISVDQIKRTIKSFKGSRRRFEYIGKLHSGALLYDDYAHHPTEIKKTLRAMRQLYPHKKLLTIFQPHTYTRTKNLFEQFIRSFADTDTLLLTDIFASKREEPDPSVSSGKLAIALRQVHRDVEYVETLSDVVEYIKAKQPGEECVIITMGAGDVYSIKDKLEIEK